MNAEVVNAGEGHALRLGDLHMVVKEHGTHTRGHWASLNLDCLLKLTTRLPLISIIRMKRVFTSSKATLRWEWKPCGSVREHS
jgi:hypothetical protein